MDDLTYELRQLCLRNRDGSHSTQANRLRILKQVAGELRELGYRNMLGKSIAGRHIDALLGHWRANGLSVGTIKNRLCALRWWTEKVGKEGVVPGDNARLGIPERRLVTNENKAQELGDSLGKVTDGHVRVSLLLERAFGLRREEAIKFTPAYADRGDRIVLKKSWRKGGRARVIPITTPVQRIVLDAAHKRAGNGSLIPAHRTYVEQLRVYEGQCKTAGLRNMHGLRHGYVHERYEALTGWRAPAAGGPSTRRLTPLQRMQDEFARQQISRELGHERSEISSVYLGK
jgi:integrase